MSHPKRHRTQPHRHPARPATLTYVPLMDWWVLILLALLFSVLVASIPLIMWSEFGWPSRLLAITGVSATVLYLTDLAFYTRYILMPNGLLIQSHITHLLIPYRIMEQIEPGNIFGLFSLYNLKRYALSSRCLRIRLRSGSWRYVTISPLAHEHFVSQLLLRIERERAARASVVER